MLDIIGKCEGGHAARAHAEEPVKIFGAAERKARSAKPAGEPFEIGAALLEHHREPEPPLFVLQKEALAMPAGKFAAQRHSLGDREDRLVRIGPVSDPERVEVGEEFLRIH